MAWIKPHWWQTIASELLSGAQSLGVLLDRSGLTLAHLEKGLSGLELRHLVCVPLSLQGPEPPSINLQAVVSPWGLQSCPVSLAISREMGFLRQVVLPRAVAENLPQVVQYELDRFFPLPADSLYFDFQVLKETDTEVHLLLMAQPREPVEACLKVLDQAGLKPVSVEPETTATVNAFAALVKRLPPSWLLWHTETEGFEVVHIEGRRIRAYRQVRLGSAEEGIPQLAAEIDRWREEGANPQALCVSDSKTPAADLTSLAKQYEFSIVDPDQLQVKGLPEARDLGGALAAVGAALRGLKKVPVSTNLLPETERSKIKVRGIFLTKLLLIILAGLSCIWAGSLLLHKRVHLYQTDRLLAHLGPETRQVARQLSESQEMAKTLEGLKQRLDQYPSKLNLLKELTGLVPENTWLFYLKCNDRQLEMGGVSRSAADLIPLLEQSGWFTKTEFASPIVTDANGREHFKIKAEIKVLGM
ncbi:MAG: PilN domain-containing protein [Desulfobacteraceae bacterium]